MTLIYLIFRNKIVLTGWSYSGSASSVIRHAGGPAAGAARDWQPGADWGYTVG